MPAFGRRIRRAVSVIGSAVVLAMPLTLAMPGTATAAETAATSLGRFANYEYKECIEENSFYDLWSRDCEIGYPGQYWRWTGTTNTSSTLQNYTWGHCLDQQLGRGRLRQRVQRWEQPTVASRPTRGRKCSHAPEHGDPPLPLPDHWRPLPDDDV